MPRTPNTTADRFWDLPARQLRAELATDSDLVIAERYGVGRMLVWRLRRAWGVPPAPRKRRTMRQQPHDT